MAKSDVPLVATGDWIDAAWLNQYLRDNIAAIWAYTTAGDLVYAASPTTLARVPIGAAGGVLKSDGSVPGWSAPGGAKGMVHTIGQAWNTAGHTTTSTTGSDIPGLSVDIVTSVTCTILMWIRGSVAVSGGTAIRGAGVIGNIGGVAQIIDASTPRGFYLQYEPFSSYYVRTGVAAGTITCKAALFIEVGDRTANFLGGSILAMAIPE